MEFFDFEQDYRAYTDVDLAELFRSDLTTDMSHLYHQDGMSTSPEPEKTANTSSDDGEKDNDVDNSSDCDHGDDDQESVDAQENLAHKTESRPDEELLKNGDSVDDEWHSPQHTLENNEIDSEGPDRYDAIICEDDEESDEEQSTIAKSTVDPDDDSRSVNIIESDTEPEVYNINDDDDHDEEEEEEPPFDPEEHNKGCAPGQVRYNTPEPPSDGASQDYAVSPTLRAIRRLHARAKLLIPDLPLAAHRYWVGILHFTKTPRNAKAERDFVWLKGNRFTTIRTLRHAYAMTSGRAETEIELRLGGVGRVYATETLEQLDAMAEKKVFFWAVETDSSGRKKDGFEDRAWDVSHGLIPKALPAVTEVVELD